MATRRRSTSTTTPSPLAAFLHYLLTASVEVAEAALEAAAAAHGARMHVTRQAGDKQPTAHSVTKTLVDTRIALPAPVDLPAQAPAAAPVRRRGPGRPRVAAAAAASPHPSALAFTNDALGRRQPTTRRRRVGSVPAAVASDLPPAVATAELPDQSTADLDEVDA